MDQDIPGGDTCSLVEASMALLGRAWAGAVLSALHDGAERFSQIRRAVPGVSDAVLSTRLRELTARGLVERHVEPGPPTVVSYCLTGAGRDTGPVLDALAAFASRHRDLLARPD